MILKIFDISNDDVPSMLSSILNETSEAIIAKAKESRTELKIAQANIELAKRIYKLLEELIYLFLGIL